MDISDISNGNIIEKGVAKHASKAYEFSHFIPYPDPMHEDNRPSVTTTSTEKYHPPTKKKEV